jgi:hemoglobin-like flavoprotein
MPSEPIPESLLESFETSLQRCLADDQFLDRFYERFLASSDEVRRKFAGTDFKRQKRALRASFHLILLAASDTEENRDAYLKEVAVRHSRKGLDIGSGLYDVWLDTLLAVVAERDPEYRAEVSIAWERVMGIGIEYLLRSYNAPEGPSGGAA